MLNVSMSPELTKRSLRTVFTFGQNPQYFSLFESMSSQMKFNIFPMAMLLQSRIQ